MSNAEATPRRALCSIGADGLVPCHALDEVLECHGVGTRYQGVKLQTLMNMKTGNFSRHLVVVKSGKHSKKGLVLNFCPFCAEELVADAKKHLADYHSSITTRDGAKP